MAGKKRASSEELTSDNLKQPRQYGQLQRSDDETSGNNGNLTSNTTGPSKPEALNHVEPSGAAIHGQGLPSDGNAATMKSARIIATPRRRRSFVTTKNGHGSFYHHHAYVQCTDAVKERREAYVASIRSLLGDDSASWLASSVKPAKLPADAHDWNTTLLEAILKLAQAVQASMSQSERRKEVCDATIAKSIKSLDGRPTCLSKSDFAQAVIWLMSKPLRRRKICTTLSS